jgi:hypothetical protein
MRGGKSGNQNQQQIQNLIQKRGSCVGTLCPHGLFYVSDFGVRYAHTAFAVDLITPVRRREKS